MSLPENPTVFDVVAAAQNMGVNSLNIQSLSNLLFLNEDEFTSDDYAAFIAIMYMLKEAIIDDWVAEHFPDKTAGSLTEEERYQMWAWESNGGLPMDARQAILDANINASNAHRIELSQSFDAELYPVFYYSMRH